MAQLDPEASSFGMDDGNALESKAVAIEVDIVSCSSRFRG